MVASKAYAGIIDGKSGNSKIIRGNDNGPGKTAGNNETGWCGRNCNIG